VITCLKKKKQYYDIILSGYFCNQNDAITLTICQHITQHEKSEISLLNFNNLRNKIILYCKYIHYLFNGRFKYFIVDISGGVQKILLPYHQYYYSIGQIQIAELTVSFIITFLLALIYICVVFKS